MFPTTGQLNKPSVMCPAVSCITFVLLCHRGTCYVFSKRKHVSCSSKVGHFISSVSFENNSQSAFTEMKCLSTLSCISGYTFAMNRRDRYIHYFNIYLHLHNGSMLGGFLVTTAWRFMNACYYSVQNLLSSRLI
jgi:hypothetical protein